MGHPKKESSSQKSQRTSYFDEFSVKTMGESDKEADSTVSDIQEPARLMVTFNVREIMARIKARCNSNSEAEQPPQIFGRESEIEFPAEISQDRVGERRRGSQTLWDILNRGVNVIDSIASHRIVFADGTHNIQLYAVIKGNHLYRTGWKTELELSWIALSEVTAYWASFPGGRDGAINSISPIFPKKRVLVVLGHRKRRYGRLELKVLYQGVAPNPIWVEDWKVQVGQDLDARTMNDYWKAIAVQPGPYGLQEVVEETTLELNNQPDWPMTMGSL
ncbi:hypothetical protein GCG54_00013900 [Colletotrichum gloeosporioides]|uniref:Uncharacterized protein n=1 Tax=Colletotrichum gloeosporioides TaxID=474922 RepID=A0A8H4CF59_COLGL|nr:uncharacterized protein GCG54_00013900 [Colletotrichum gloeosporioides]KAF3802666.1 hypothetical protein GCG54_00013900 [Colletotrichum gloeosporioides]